MRIDYGTLHKRFFDPYKHTLFIFDENTYNYHSNKIIALDLNKSTKYYEYIIPCGESSKDFSIIEEICEFLSSNNFPRKDSCIIAVGGGVVGDLAGFVASIYMRGVDFIQVPTTLLAMVDSSIGGKNGINNKHGKNLIGTIRQPNKIIIDISFLETLPIEEFINGMAEIIKIAATSNCELWSILYKYNLESVIQDEDLLLDIIKRSANTKMHIVEKDEFEKSEDVATSRMVLNYGHTIGHAIEKLTGERHGYCVAVGMVLEIDPKNILIRNLIISCLSKYRLPTETEDNLDTERLIEFIKNDKKGNKMITLDNIGKPQIVEFDVKDIHHLFHKTVLVKSNPIINKDGINKDEMISFTAPGSKSETNRILLLAAFGRGKCVIKDALICDDTVHMIYTLLGCGVVINIEDNIITVYGSNGELFDNGRQIIPREFYIGNSGTCMRFLLPILSTCIPYNDFNIILRGDKWMDKRPMTELVSVLNAHGCNIKEKPITIDCKYSFQGGSIEFNDGISSQYISGIMMAAPHATNSTIIKIHKKYPSLTFIDLTYHIMKKFNINITKHVENNGYIYYNIIRNSYMNPSSIEVECDATACIYPMVYSILNEMNMNIANIKESNRQGDFRLYQKLIRHDYHEIDMDSSDTFMTFCVLFSFIPEKFHVYNIANQNKKECRRIDATYEALQKCGVDIKLINDEIIIHGKKTYPTNKDIIYLDCYDDHRLVMSFSLLASKMNNIVLSNYKAVSKTYPSFWEDMRQLGLDYEHYLDAPQCNTDTFAVKDVIVLIGMPGIGKSTYGRYIADELDMEWIDTDDEILKVIDCSILDFINKFGWDEFRKLEYRVLCDVVQQDNVLISTGGGIIEYEKSRKLLNIIQYSILLRRDDHDDKDHNNIYGMTHQNLWEKRKHWYRECSRYEHYTTSKYDFKHWLDKIMNKFSPRVHSTFLSLANNHFYELDIPRGVSCIEYRYDLYPDNMEYDINALHLITENPILFTDHSFSGMEEFAQRIGCTMIDIDMEMEKNISFHKYPNTYVIASIHCDDYEKIVHIVNLYLKTNDPDMIKIVADIGIQTDLDKYVKKLEKKYKVIHLYKGIEGRMSRILNKYLTPVCGENSETKTDEGQMSIVDLVKSRRLLFEGGDRIEKYCLFGKPICHSKSPEIHNRFFDEQNWLATYYKYETDNPIVAFREFQKNKLMGASVTIPLKESLIEYVDVCSKDVKEIGVLNTLTRMDDGRIKADNTDWIAIYDEIYKLDLMNTYILRNSIRAFVIGTGATAKSACYAIHKLGYKLYIKGRSREKMDYFCTKYDATVINENSDFIAMDIIIITIPGCVELDLREYKDSVCIIEMAYNDVMKRKYPKYAKIIDGRTILYEQAIYQNKIWSKRV